MNVSSAPTASGGGGSSNKAVINSNRNHGTCTRLTEDSGQWNENGAETCPRVKTQSVSSGTHANVEEEVAASAAPQRVICDHVQFLITEKQTPRDCNGDVAGETQSADDEGQRKANLNDFDEQEEWPTGG